MSLRLIFILLAVVYFLSPIDLIPDRMGWVSRIDDLLVIVFLWWKYRQIKKHGRWSEAAYHKSQSRDSNSSHAGETKYKQEEAKQFDPYDVLDLTPGATRGQLDATYRKLMTQYHPDKVAHLGPELREVAHEKSVEITRAYEMLKDSITS